MRDALLLHLWLSAFPVLPPPGDLTFSCLSFFFFFIFLFPPKFPLEGLPTLTCPKCSCALPFLLPQAPPDVPDELPWLQPRSPPPPHCPAAPVGATRALLPVHLETQPDPTPKSSAHCVPRRKGFLGLKFSRTVPGAVTDSRRPLRRSCHQSDSTPCLRNI